MDGLQWKTLLKLMIWGTIIFGNIRIYFDVRSVHLESLLRCRDLSVSEKWLFTGRLQARRALPVLEEAGEQNGEKKEGSGFAIHLFCIFWCEKVEEEFFARR